MLLRTLALAVITLAGSAFAQCGTNQLVTAPNYVSNNGGAVGGAVYFQLNVLNPNGVSICGISLNSSLGAGAHIAGTVHRHLTVTDPFLLTSANVTAANWDTRCAVSGTSAGQDLPSVCSVISGTNTLDLPPGLHLLAIDACPNWAHRYTNGNVVNHTATDLNLTYYGGRATNVGLSGTPFGSATSGRVTNATFDYSVPASPVTITPAGFTAPPCATSVSTGTGCGASGVGASIREEFLSTPDLIVPAVSSEDVIFTDVGGTVSVTTAPGTPIVAPIAPNLGLGDDQNTPLIQMGFIASIGGRAFQSISMASNGYVFLGTTGLADFSPTGAELTAQGARIAPYWFDFAPNLGGTTHIDVSAGLVICTWLNCWPFAGTGPEGTVQLEITASSLRCRFDPNGGTWVSTASQRIVGFSNGVSHAAPAMVDLNGGSVPPVTGSATADLSLTTDSVAFAGGTGTWRTSGIPFPGGIAGTLAEIGVAGAPVLLPSPPFAVGCNQYVSNSAIVLALYFASLEGTVSISIPAGPSFLGLPLVLQSAAIGGAAGYVTSNAVNAVVGI